MKNPNDLNTNKYLKINKSPERNKLEMPYIITNTSSKKINFTEHTIPKEKNLLKQTSCKIKDDFKSQLMKPTKVNDTIQDYLSLIRCTYPYCNCAKCIMKKNKDYGISPNYNYDRNIQTNYRNEFNWKNPVKIDHIKNAKISRIGNGFKEYLKSGLISTSKNDYKNFHSTENRVNTEPISINGSKKNVGNDVRMDIPFLGRSSYETLYPNWKTFIDKKNVVNTEVKDSVPFNGKSSYRETYGSIEKKYYLEKTSPILKKDNLEIGKADLITKTTSGEFYKPIDYQKANDMNNLKLHYLPYVGNITTGPYIKDSFMSSYERAFMNNNFKNPYKVLNTEN